MVPETSLQRSQGPATGPCPELDASTLFPEDPL
jgi:hypothetical protein